MIIEPLRGNIGSLVAGLGTLVASDSLESVVCPHSWKSTSCICKCFCIDFCFKIGFLTGLKADLEESLELVELDVGVLAYESILTGESRSSKEEVVEERD